MGKKCGNAGKPSLLMYAHYYYPDVASTGQILTELAEGMKDNYDVTVICVVPSYSGVIAPEYKQKKFYEEDINGVHVIRVRVPEFCKENKLSRVRNILAYFVRAIMMTRKVGHMDYVYTISQPPILGGLLGVVGKRIKKAKMIYNVQDFNPEQIMAVKYTKNQALLKLMLKIDTYCCKKADKVIVVGRDMEKTLEGRFKNQEVPQHCFINNWVDEKSICPLETNHPKIQEFKEKYNLQNKFIIMYSGNIGLYYDLENIMHVIEEFKDNKDVVFAFVGSGSVKEKLVSFAERQHMDNVVFIPYQRKEDLIYSLNAADVHWVVNAAGIKGVSVPSKLYGVMAVAKPVIGVLDEGSEARLIIEECGCGMVTETGDYSGIRQIIQNYIDIKNSEKIKALGEAGRKYLEQNLTKECSVEKYIVEIAG